MILTTLLLVLPGTPATPDAHFDDHFTGLTLRFDYFHTGDEEEEHIALDEIRLEGPWPGSRTKLLDDTNLGKFLFEVVDAATNRALYTRGFASIYGEWETTGEARAGTWRSLHESQRFPEPKHPCQLTLKKRANDGTFREIFSTHLDPAHRSVNRSPIPSNGTVRSVFRSGDPAVKVDLLFLGDGYAEEDQARFREQVASLTEVLFATEPFKRNRDRFNVWAIDVVSEHTGVTDPRAKSWNRTPLGLSYNAFDSERYVLTHANRDLREIAAQAPYDAIVLLANNRKYGGGGIFNLWCTAASLSSQAPYLVVHELGHSFGGLADEYYTSQVSYEECIPAGVEPWEPNITALLDPDELKWKDLVEASTPLPTPWNQDDYDEASLAYQKRRAKLRAAGASEADIEALFEEVKRTSTAQLMQEERYDSVGAFEGAGYQAKGLYRSSVDCIMFTRNPKTLCPVCERGIERVIDLYAD